MQDVLSPLGLVALRSFFAQRPLIIFDFDGTLAPLTDRREAAQLSPLTRALLARLSHWTSVAVVSGRSLLDLGERLHGLDQLLLAGNHGGESSVSPQEGQLEASRKAKLQVEAFLGELQSLQLLDAMPSDVLENKVLSLTFHWRGVRPEWAHQWANVVRAVAAEVGEFRVIPGIESLSIVPRGLWDKGEAVQDLLANTRKSAALYVGDEETDEDVFRRSESAGIFGIRVGESPESAARWFIQEQADVDRLLEVFLASVAGPTAAVSVA